MTMPGLRLALSFQRVDPSRGGAETYVADLCHHLIRAGHAIDLLAESWAEDALPPEVQKHRITVSGRGRLARIRSFAQEAARVLASRSYDCSVGLINTIRQDVLIPQGGVHGASLDHNAQRFPAGWRRAVYWGLKRANPKHGFYQAIEARQYDARTGALRIVAVSRMVQGHLERYHGVSPERIRVIPNAINADRLALPDRPSVRAETRKAFGFRPDEVVALFVAHNFRLKGLPDLLKALHLRARRAPNGRPVRLLVCGGGHAAPMQRLARSLGLESQVQFAGFVPDVRRVFHSCDLFVLPTYYDPCSLVVFEALACGLPVITTARNGAGELITPGSEGFVIPEPRSHEALAEALDRLADDTFRAACSARALALGQAQTMERHVERLVAVFEEVAASKREIACPGSRRSGPLSRERSGHASHHSGGG